MALLSSAELKRIEHKYADGISSTAAVEVFRTKGERFSEATLRKYVQLDLLPKSKRVGARGRHRGSSGLYPVGIVRLINEIKRALENGATLEEIRYGRVGLGGEVEALQRASQQVLLRFAEAIDKHPNRVRRSVLKKALEENRRLVNRGVRQLDKLATKIGGASRP